MVSNNANSLQFLPGGVIKFVWYTPADVWLLTMSVKLTACSSWCDNIRMEDPCRRMGFNNVLEANGLQFLLKCVITFVR